MATGHTNSRASSAQQAFPFHHLLDTRGREWTRADHARGDVGETSAAAAIAGIALPDEAELKKLARYRAMLELSLQRWLAALEQILN